MGGGLAAFTFGIVVDVRNSPLRRSLSALGHFLHNIKYSYVPQPYICICVSSCAPLGIDRSMSYANTKYQKSREMIICYLVIHRYKKEMKKELDRAQYGCTIQYRGNSGASQVQ